MFNAILNELLKIIFPPKCVFCKGFLLGEQEICDVCKEKLAVIKNKRVIEFNYGKMFFERCVALFYYLPPVSSVICNFKFNGKNFLKNTLARFICDMVEQEYVDVQFDCIMFVPELNRKRKHCKLLAEQVSKIVGLPLAENLVKLKKNQKQHELKLKSRLENIKGAYGLNDVEAVVGQTVLLVDDVVTTGSTLNECARILKVGGVMRVFCATIAATAGVEDLCLANES
ncbi:MAG: double zinc ribbon domain-containing protein [Oscillospiraceae bacterium]|jgi:ComF family protein|nr:double zinc ribbon domain-containing protein [Oscillospiraceae bacterium]